MKKLLIIGGGFGGTYTAKSLENSENLEITVVDTKNYFLFTPLLHEVATGGLDESLIIEPFERIFNKEVNFIKDKIMKIDFSQKKAFALNNTFDYDYLVISTGAVPNKFESSRNVYSLKTIKDAQNIKNSLSKLILHKGKISISIVGAGATGIELIAEIYEFLKNHAKCQFELNLIQNSNKIMPRYSEKIQDYVSAYLQSCNINILKNKKIEKVEEKYLILNDGSRISSDLTVFTHGVKASIPFLENFSEYDDGGRIVASDNLNLQSHPEVFVCGDIVSGHEFLAQVAEMQAKTVSRNILNSMNGKDLVAYTYKPVAHLISLGQSSAMLEVKNMFFAGKLIWFIWRTVYLFKIPTLKKRIEISLNWTFNLFSVRDTTIID